MHYLFSEIYSYLFAQNTSYFKFCIYGTSKLTHLTSSFFLQRLSPLEHEDGNFKMALIDA